MALGNFQRRSAEQPHTVQEIVSEPSAAEKRIAQNDMKVDIRLPRDVWLMFKDVCEQEDTTPSADIREYILSRI